MAKVRKHSRIRLPLIVCECGSEQLIVPDLEHMSQLIETHAEAHQKMESDPLKAEATFVRIQNLLLDRLWENLA
jgi:hypothetical protein